LALLGIAVLASLAPPVAAAPQRASLPDVEDEVMCPSCGTPLNLAASDQAASERNFIRRQIEAGKTKEEIKRALVAQFGSSVLAMPSHHGFALTAYLVPAGAVGIAAIAIAVGLVRWRRREVAAESAAAADLPPADAARLERDLSRYDL
jgi:cytochrome c-type biogenesis protein CcmH